MITLAGIPSSYRPKLYLYRLFNIIAVMRTAGDSVGLLTEDDLGGNNLKRC